MKNKSNVLPTQPIETKTQIVKTVKKALIQERDAGNLPATCRIKVNWIQRIYTQELYIIISGLDVKVYLPKLGKDGKIVLSPESKKMQSALKKVLENNMIQNVCIETRYGDVDNIKDGD